MGVEQVYAHYERGERPAEGYTYCPLCRSRLVAAECEHWLRRTCPHCGYVQHMNPAPSVSVLVVEGDSVLLGRRGGEPGRGTWSLPSGYIEYEDDFLSTAIREAKEETGLDVELCGILNVLSSFVSPQYHFLGIYLLARVVGGELRAGDDLEAVAWYPLAGPLPAMGFQEDVDVIAMYAAGRHEGLPVDERYTAASRR